MVNFTVDQFNYLKTGDSECDIGGDPDSFANAPVLGVEFEGIANIPSHVTYNNIEYTVTGISKYAFRSCSKMTGVNIPTTVTKLGFDNFYGTKIKHLFIPKGVTEMTSSVISNMNELLTVEFEEGSQLRYLPGHVFGSAFKLESVVIPGLIDSVGGGIFLNDNNLKTIVFCGSYDFSNANDVFENASPNVKIYVTPRYPKGATFGGRPVIYLDHYCHIGMKLGIHKTCTNQQSTRCAFLLNFFINIIF